MGELLDRSFQRKILDELAHGYPSAVDIPKTFGAQYDNRLLVNLSYLSEHGLVEMKLQRYISGDLRIYTATITASGLDFLADDGGLSAVLGVVTVKLHEDTVKGLLIQEVAASTADASVKDRLIDRIKELPAEATATLATKVLEAGIAQLPNAVGLLQKLLF